MIVPFLTLSVFIFGIPSSLQAENCPLSPDGYYKPPTPNGPYVSGLPADSGSLSYTALPPGLSCADLANVHKLCVSRINEYRAGTRRFSNGLADSALGSPQPLKYASGMDKCHSEITLGDFALMGSCSAGAHQNAWNCKGYGGSFGQNLCCPRPISSTDTFNSLVNSMYGCLQQMWDEGQDPGAGVDGHWLNMKAAGFNYASCGFAFGTSGSSPYVLMTQNFGGYYSGATTPLNDGDSGSTSSPTADSGPISTKAPTKKPTRAPTKRPSMRRPTKTPTKRPTKRKLRRG